MALLNKIIQMGWAALAAYATVMIIRTLLFADPLIVAVTVFATAWVIAILAEVAEYLDRREVHKIREEYEEQASDQIDRE